MSQLRRHEANARAPRYTLRMAGLAMILTALGLVAQDTQLSSPNGTAHARPAVGPRIGHLVRVPLPITGDADQAVRGQIRRILEGQRHKDGAGEVLVLEFSGGDEEQTGAGSESGRSYDLAKFLVSDELRGVHTIAYVPHKLGGHALLPVMACREIVVHEDAELAAIGAAEQPITAAERGLYAEIEAQRHTLPAAVALGLLDPSISVAKVDLKDGAKWMTGEELDAVRESPAYAGHTTLWPNNDPHVLSAAELRQHGFATHVASDKENLRALLKLSALSNDPAFRGDWRAIRIELAGPMNAALVTQAQRAIDDEMLAAEHAGEPINFICLSIDSAGGSAADSIALINYLEGLDRDQVYVSAYIPGIARADAAIVAMACDGIAMGPRATMGGSGENVINKDDAADLVERIRTISKARSGRWSLWAAMIDAQQEVRAYTREGTHEVAYFTRDELDEQPDKDVWVAGDVFVRQGSLFKTDAAEAQRLGLIDHTVDDYQAYLRTFDLDHQPRLVHRNWAHQLVDGMRQSCFLPWLLVFLGVVALMIEVSSPGVGLPGFISLVCFVLFFWLMMLNGTATSLEILLFVVGLVCIAVEIFILPGFGAFGFGGGALVIVALVLASQTFVIPRNEYQFERLPFSLLTVVAAGAGVIAGALLMRRFMDKAPGFRSMMLEPPTGEEQSHLNQRESLANFTHLRGKRGVASTRLTPSGKARFGDETVNVISRGPLVDKGTDVTVVDVQGSIVVVEPIE
jgi:membrane-bound ClpP family serine protease